MGRIWICHERQVSLARLLVMAIVNATPDSFSDGGAHAVPAEAVAFAQEALDAGADILDVGGESTRPGATPVPVEEEMRRVLPVIRGIVSARPEAIVSIDTRHAEVAAAAVAAGAAIVNATAWFGGDEAMARVVRESGAGLVIMHTPDSEAAMNRTPLAGDAVAAVEAALRGAVAFAAARGISPKRIVIDPGIGFAKDTRQDLELLRATRRLSAVAPVLIGASRKRFVGELSGEPVAAKRLGGSVAVALLSAEAGAAVVRVHDVAATVQALRILEAWRK